MQTIPGLSAIAPGYDALLLDLWGVIHDGTHLYPGVHETLVQLRQAAKKIIFISNAPRRTHKAVSALTQFGITPDLYDHAITSGELGYQWLASGKAAWGRHYYYIGPSKDTDVIDGLEYKRVDGVKEADFLLNVGFGSDEQSPEDWQTLLRAAKSLKLSMLCLNPDFEVVKITGERYACAGVLAADYERMGGKVTYFGKPFAEIYEQCMEWLTPIPKSQVLAVGDGIATDIAGATCFGLDALLITDGICKRDSSGGIEALCRKHNAIPRYVMPRLVW